MFTRLTLSCLALVGTVGCGGVDPADMLAQANSNNIQRLANLYGMYQSRNDWQGPADEASFKSFLNGRGSKLKRLGIDVSALDEIFVNERDGEPFKIRYGVPGSAMGSTEPVIFESSGIDGMRMVGFLDMTQREVDGSEYERLWTQGTSLR